MGKDKITANFLIQAVAKAISVGLGLFMTVLLTRALQGPNGETTMFGEYTTAITFLQLFGVVVDLGLTLTLPAMLAQCQNREEEQKLVSTAFLTRFATSGFLFGLAPLIGYLFDWSHTTHQAVFVGSLAYIIMSGTTVLIGVFQKYQEIWRASLAEIASRIVLVTLTLLGTFLHWGVVPFVAVLIAANLVWMIGTLFMIRALVPLRLYWSKHLCVKILERSWPIALSIFFNLIYLKTDILFLSVFRGPEEVGLYGLAYRFLDVVTNIPVMYMGILLPALAADWGRGASGEFGKHLRVTSSLFWLISLPLVGATLVLSADVLRLIGGASYVPAALILSILILAVPGLFFGGLFGHVVVALNEQRKMIWRYGSVALITLIGYLILIPRFGALGAASMTIFSEILVAFLAFLVVRKTTTVPLSFNVAAKALLASLLMALVIIGARPIGLVASIISGGAVYLLILWLTKAFTHELIEAIIPERLTWKRRKAAI